MEADTQTELPWDLLGPATGGLSIGIVLQGTYRIVRPLAEGGCGEIYLAAHTRLPGRFAVKLLHRSLVRDSDAFSRFQQEAEITSSLRHPHIVQVFDFNITDSGVPYLVMELLEGRLLAQRIAAGALAPATAADIIDQIASALHAAHSRGIVHRDLKPENVMLLADAGVPDFVKVLDFGISQASWRPRLTEGERVAGTPQYMSPEQACGLREQIDHRSDQFSLAAIAYVLLTGREPFTGDNPIAVLYEVVHQDPPPPSQVIPTLNPEIDAVVMRGLAKESADRYPNVLAFASALRAAVHGGATAAFNDPISDPPPVRTPAPALVREPLGAVPFNAISDDPVDIQPAPVAAGRDTVRLIRRMRWRQFRTPRRFALLTLVAVAVLTWFLPTTGQPARAAWRHAGAQMRIMVERVLPADEIRP
jgi:serine/threonine protein kinase